MIVLEDLGLGGFVMQDRNVGLDEHHCRLVLQKLASLHATSLALQAENPQRHEKLVAQLKENIFDGTVPRSYKAAMDTANCEHFFIFYFLFLVKRGLLQKGPS